jgi:hypothetical protein
MPLADIMAQLVPLLPPDMPFLGPDDVDTQQSAPSISWAPVSASHHPPKRLGGGSRGPEGELWHRSLVVAVKLWGRSHTETEELLGDFVNAAHSLLTAPGYELGGEQWSHGGPQSSGFECVLSLVLLLPLQRTPVQRRKLTAITTTFKLNDTEV